MEVYHISIKATQEHEDIADFWDDQAGEAGMHPGHWMLIANQLVDQQNLDLAEAARMFLLSGVAVHDAGIAAWSQKYDEMIIRPESYIQRYIDPLWEPFLDTPNFPEYPSGHATFGAATAEVLTGVWGVMPLIDNGGIVDDMGRSRTFSSLEAAAYENGLSRLYGGIHYRMGMEAGLRTGECIGQRILGRLEGQAVSMPHRQSNVEPIEVMKDDAFTTDELDIPRQWIELIHQQVDQRALDLPTTARIIAYMSLALHEAIGHDDAMIRHQIAGPPAMPERDPARTYHDPAVAIGALSTVVDGLLVEANNAGQGTNNRMIQNAVVGVRNLQVRRRLQIASRSVVDDSLALGNAIGEQIVTWAATDGFADAATPPLHGTHW